MRKQYKKARYKRAMEREINRRYPGIKTLRKAIEGMRKAAEECGRSIATAINNMIERS